MVSSILRTTRYLYLSIEYNCVSQLHVSKCRVKWLFQNIKQLQVCVQVHTHTHTQAIPREDRPLSQWSVHFKSSHHWLAHCHEWVQAQPTALFSFAPQLPGFGQESLNLHRPSLQHLVWQSDMVLHPQPTGLLSLEHSWVHTELSAHVPFPKPGTLL